MATFVKLTTPNGGPVRFVNLDLIIEMTVGEYRTLGEPNTRLWSVHRDDGDRFTIDVIETPEQILWGNCLMASL